MASLWSNERVFIKVSLRKGMLCETQGRPGQCRKEEQEEHWTGSQRAGVPAWAPAGLGALLTEAAPPDLIRGSLQACGEVWSRRKRKPETSKEQLRLPALGSDPVTDWAMSLPLRGPDTRRTKWYGTKCHPQRVALGAGSQGRSLLSSRLHCGDLCRGEKHTLHTCGCTL